MVFSEKDSESQFHFVVAGASSGFITRMLCQPLDVLKIRFQLQVEPIKRHATSKYQSIFHATELIIREEGLKALWKGHVPAQLLSVVYGIAQFWSFEMLLRESTFLKLPKDLTPVINFSSGAIAGSFATVVSFPFDVLRTRLISQHENKKIYLGSLHAFVNLVKHEGVLVLYRGLWPTIIQVAPNTGVQFMCFKFFDGLYTRTFNNAHSTLSSSLISGSLAGFIAKTAVYPFDLVKKRLQIQGFKHGRDVFGEHFECRGMSHCLAKIYRHEGAAGFFKGLAPSLIKAVVTGGLYFASYEMTLEMLRKL